MHLSAPLCTLSLPSPWVPWDPNEVTWGDPQTRSDSSTLSTLGLSSHAPVLLRQLLLFFLFLFFFVLLLLPAMYLCTLSPYPPLLHLLLDCLTASPRLASPHPTLHPSHGQTTARATSSQSVTPSKPALLECAVRHMDPGIWNLPYYFATSYDVGLRLIASSRSWKLSRSFYPKFPERIINKSPSKP